MSREDAPTWRSATASDLEVVDAIGNQVHVALPERAEVFAEKMRLFPEGCLVLAQGSDVVGYGLSHPWLLNNVPRLDHFLQTLPANPECLFIHDVVVLPGARGHGAAGAFVDRIVVLAKARGI